MKSVVVRILFLSCSFFLLNKSALYAQDPTALLNEIRTKMEKIADYEADARFKTEIPFLKVPDATVRIYYKRPDKVRIVNQSGISLVPRETTSISLYQVLNSPCQTLDAGKDVIGGIPVRIVKLLPSDENSDLILSTIYIDPKRLLILKAKTTSRRNGTNEVELFYGKFIQTGLPDKIIFTFNSEEFKLPKGVTFDYDDGSSHKNKGATGNQQGKIEITYLSYSINRGISDSLFK
jgi:outer membrane lipoprotein-sorting protein